MEKLPVFFNRKMGVDVLETPSPRKPLEVVAHWIERYPVSIFDFPPATVNDFYLAHQAEHVDGVIELRIPNGMDTCRQDVVDSLYWTTGSMIAASKHALKHQISVSPTSGFHHAGYDFSWGFCTFNGLLIATRKMLIEDGVGQVGILDFDQHQGDGSEDIIRRLGLERQVVHVTGKSHYTRERQAFFKELPALLSSFSECDVVLYQAGADQHIDDPLGGFLNDDELRVRDRMVFEFFAQSEIPLAWNLAGGYQVFEVDGIRSIQKVLDIHNATLEECWRAYGSGSAARGAGQEHGGL